jgi:hypothetical protein
MQTIVHGLIMGEWHGTYCPEEQELCKDGYFPKALVAYDCIIYLGFTGSQQTDNCFLDFRTSL